MNLNQLVKINENALVANAVSFELMDDPDKNLRLCKGFVFNYESDPNKLKSSTVGVLDALRRSFHSQNEPNVHLMVQDYGKGKSHFALAVANFFNKPFDSQEVQGILQQIEYATSRNNPILEGLKSYKKRSRHLVICLSGDKTIDLKKHFLQALRKSLESEGISDSIAQQVCQKPLKYLENLNTEDRKKADAYLKELGNPEGDLHSIMRLLREDNYQVVSRVKEISRQLTGTGLPLDFEVDLDIESILTDLNTQLCSGENRRFQGILILFDELYNYLQLWANDPVQAGSTTLQNITNICEKFKGRVALISFTQRLPGGVTPTKNSEDYNRLVSRLKPNTYEPAASLELVLKGLLSQQDKTSTWREFDSKWRNTLNAINSDIYENHTANFYKNRNWSTEKFKTDITLGCFPLHPLTSYLLCNLDFTQGRTALQFVQNDVKQFIREQSVEKNSNINFIYPVTLVDAFEVNFSKSDYSSYSAYKQAYDAIVASAEPEELTVLKSLFLFYAGASTKKLTKLDNEKHEEILILLSGMPQAKIKEVLHKLCKVREVIYHNPADNTYRFYTGGVNIQDLRKRIEEEIANKNPSLDKVREYLPSNLTDTVFPTKFIDDNRLISSDWFFKCKVYTVANFRKVISSNNLEDLGIVAYVIAETAEELTALRSEITEILASSSHESIKRRFAVAIASHPAFDIAKLLLMLETAERKNVQEFGEALNQLKQQLQQQIEAKAKELFKSCIYHFHVSNKVPRHEQSNPSRVVSEILKDLYPFVPPVEKIDKMALTNSMGGQIIGYVSKRLIENNLRPQDFTNKAYPTTVDTVFVKSWGLLKKSSHQYTIQEPLHPNIKAAWDKISQMTELGNQSAKTVKIAEIWQVLSQTPYGYNEYTFTILFATWLAYNSSELLLKGPFEVPKKKSFSIKNEAIKNWANTNVFDKPKDFVREWIKNGQPSVIRRKLSPCPEVPNSIDYEQANQFIEEINNFLNAAPDPDKVDEINRRQQQLISGIKQIDAIFKPTLQVESLSGKIDIKTLLQLYLKLQQPLEAITETSLTVTPSEQQENRLSQALQTVIEKIGQTVEAESQRCQSLLNEDDCSDYKDHIEDLIEQISKVDNLPSWFTTKLQEALLAADKRLAEIIEQKKDEKIIQEIRQHTLAKANTIKRCEDEIEEIISLSKKLHNLELFNSEIEQLVHEFRNKLATYQNKLQEIGTRLSIVENTRELSQIRDDYAKLDLVFQESNESDNYQQLQDKIILLELDLEQIQNWESLNQQSNSIADCDKNLAIITKDKINLHDLERFSSKLEQLENQLCQRKQGYIQRLNELQNKLSSITTWQEAQKFQKELFECSRYYQESALKEQYETICSKINDRIILLSENEKCTNTESKIFDLFITLPRQQQESLLKRLAEYVSGSREDL